MKKLILAVFLSVTSAFSASLGVLEVSPEIGLSGGKISSDGYNPSNYGAYARIWLGTFGFVVAPQAKIDFYSQKYGGNSLNNGQYGASIGTNFGLGVRLTPYVGANYSSFNKVFNDTWALNAGLKVKFPVLPLALSFQYTYQNPELAGTSTTRTMHNVQFLLGLHF